MKALMSSVVCRRIYAADFEIMDMFIANGAIAIPERAFTNSLFREITFSSKEDAEAFDFVAFIAGIDPS
jgi:hypothetical protein